jgi:hypothetical protein
MTTKAVKCKAEAVVAYFTVLLMQLLAEIEVNYETPHQCTGLSADILT